MSSSQLFLRRYGIEPRELPICGFFQPEYLILNIAYDSTLWQAITEWLREHGGKPPPLDLSDPYDRMTAQALMVREHELAHFTAFLTNPCATTIQCLGLMRDALIFDLARILHEAGQPKLRIPLKRWRQNYELDLTTASRIEHVEAEIMGYTAVAGMLMYGISGVNLPASLRDEQTNRTFWPWIRTCEQIKKKNIAAGGITFRDVHEGLAVISETRMMAHVGVSFDQFLKLRRGLLGEYSRVPSIISQTLGGWYEVTAGIVLNVAAVFPAVAVLQGADDWPRFDASACLIRVLDAATQLGPTLDHIRADEPLDKYIKSIFEHSYPGFEPARLLHQDYRARIEAAFGIDKIKNMEEISQLLPSLRWLEKAQSEIDVEFQGSWERRFLPFPLDLDRWFPTIIWFHDILSRHTDLDTYTSTRIGFLNSQLANSLFYRSDLIEVEEWCFGGLEGQDVKVKGKSEYLSWVVEQATGYSAKDVCSGTSV